MASLMGHGCHSHVWEMVPVAGHCHTGLVMVLLEQRSWMELQGIWPSLGPWWPHILDEHRGLWGKCWHGWGLICILFGGE